MWAHMHAPPSLSLSHTHTLFVRIIIWKVSSVILSNISDLYLHWAALVRQYLDAMSII